MRPGLWIKIHFMTILLVLGLIEDRYLDDNYEEIN